MNQNVESRVRKEARLFLDAAEAATDRLIDVSPALKLWKKRGEHVRNWFFLDIHAPNGLCERLDYRERYSNTAKNDFLEIFLFRYTTDHEEAKKPATRIAERNFVPFITLEDKVLWKAKDGLHESIKLIESAHSEFIEQIAQDKRLL